MSRRRRWWWWWSLVVVRLRSREMTEGVLSPDGRNQPGAAARRRRRRRGDKCTEGSILAQRRRPGVWTPNDASAGAEIPDSRSARTRNYYMD
ncbi:hypothetical protein BZA05DRAFT_409732 [Tricharina praecox]|uniref:uncharacterized protein n=1 Tax=Tricharina praecox TaxID=43433 RepID=UPI00221EFC58|nr:uncharacterized protein BZA05DRAFT_409732 [Tricharina praecox]KAI5844321.1 hypothetical protein BZA05DRAFT_409732 [Tricharina praecox]